MTIMNEITLICFHPDLDLGERYFITLRESEAGWRVIRSEAPDRFNTLAYGTIISFDDEGNSPIIMELGTSLHLEDAIR